MRLEISARENNQELLGIFIRSIITIEPRQQLLTIEFALIATEIATYLFFVYV